jgi:hypothetical protein
MTLKTCIYCGAMTPKQHEEFHVLWHGAHGLHGPDCALVEHARLSRMSDWHIEKPDCSCGLDRELAVIASEPRYFARRSGTVHYPPPQAE